MPLAPTVDNFADLVTNPWANNGMAAASNLVSAAVAGTWGDLSLAHGVPSQQATIVCEITPDKTDTVGRFILAGQIADTAGQAGQGVGYIAGTGICAFNVNSQAVSGSPVVALADADITTGQRYYVAATFRPQWLQGNWEVVVQVYDQDMFFVGGSRVTASNSAFVTFDFVTIAGTSAASKAGRFGWMDGYFPSSAVRDYFRATSVGWREVGADGVGDANRKFGVYVPGAMTNSPPVVALHFHGSGSWSVNTALGSGAGTDWDRATPSQMSNITFGLLDAGVPVISPGGYSSGAANTANWGCPDAYEEVKTVIEWVRGQLGSDTKLLLYGFSMGGLLALRLVCEGEVGGIEGVYLQNPVTGLFAAWNDSGFTAGVEAAWATYADSDAAHAALDPFDPHLLVASNPERWAGVNVLITSSVDDAVVDPTVYSDVLSAAMTAAGITHTHTQRPFGTHTDAGTPGDIGRFISSSLRMPDALQLGALEAKLLATVDGLSVAAFNEVVLSYVAGKSSVVDNGDGTKTITHHKQDGVTPKLAITFRTTSGEWESVAIT